MATEALRELVEDLFPDTGAPRIAPLAFREAFTAAADAIDAAEDGSGGPGGDGDKGWSPILAIVSDGQRRVLQIVDWTGGEGAEPSTTNQFLGASGIVSTAAAAVDVRGAIGQTGTAGSVWQVGSGLPSDSLGADTDMYLRSTNGDVYQRTAGTYSVVANIKGAPGTGEGGAAVWGGITGTLSAQTDLAAAIASAQSAAAASAIAAIRNGVTTVGDDLAKQYALIQAINAIIGGATADGDSLVNTVAELLAAFSTFPEGVTMVNALAAKLDVSTYTTNRAADRAEAKVATNIIQDSTHRFVTDTEKAAWNAAGAGSQRIVYASQVSTMDGTADNSADFQAAIDALEAAGGGVFILDGIARGGIEVPSNVVVDACGFGVLRALTGQGVAPIRNKNPRAGITTGGNPYASIVDENITIRRIYIDGNRRNGASGTADPRADATGKWIGGVEMFGVRNLNIEDVKVYDACAFGIWVHNIDNLYDGNLEKMNVRVPQANIDAIPGGAISNQDGVHFNGPVRITKVVRNISGTTADDLVPLNADDGHYLPAYLGVFGPNVTWGDIEAHFDGIYSYYSASIVRCLSAVSKINATFKNVRGTYWWTAFLLDYFDPSMGHGGQNGTIVIDDWDITPVDNYSLRSAFFVRVPIDNLIIRGLKSSNFDSHHRIRFSGYADVKNLQIDGFTLDSTVDESPIVIEPGATVRRVSLNGINRYNPTNGITHTSAMIDGTVGTISDLDAHPVVSNVPAPIALWHMDEASGDATDSSGNAYTLTNNGGVTYAAGSLNNAAFFGSGKYFESATLPHFADEYSISFRIKMAAYTAGVHSLIGFWNAPSGSSWLVYVNNNGPDNGKMHFIVSGDGTTATYTDIGMSSALSTGAWHKIVATFENGIMKLYANGGLVATGTGASTLFVPSSATKFRIGTDMNASYYTDTAIDEVEYWDVVLDAAQIASL